MEARPIPARVSKEYVDGSEYMPKRPKPFGLLIRDEIHQMFPGNGVDLYRAERIPRRQGETDVVGKDRVDFCPLTELPAVRQRQADGEQPHSVPFIGSQHPHAFPKGLKQFLVARLVAKVAPYAEPRLLLSRETGDVQRLVDAEAWQLGCGRPSASLSPSVLLSGHPILDNGRSAAKPRRGNNFYTGDPT
jgi:hypothetical protein